MFLFLDIDGVLVTEKHLKTLPREEIMDELGLVFDPESSRNLKIIVEKTGAKIVVSSTWRLEGLEFIRKVFKERLSLDVHAITPNFNSIRGEEIAWFMERNPGTFIILDDDTDFLPEQLPFFIKIEGGITSKDVEKACILLR